MSGDMHYECTSCPSKMSSLRAKVREAASAFGFNEDTVAQLVLAVDEACTNIIRHAYEGRDDGKIEVDARADNGVWEVRVRDYGKKGDPGQIKGRELHDVKPGGLGLFFIQLAFDDVQFDHTLKEGTCLILRKKKA